ncbi:MAG: hypothetical protein FWG65_01590, partial [Turicibacter sp.]|nr:hypothetical protein [Turicibacter sp.]
MKNLNKIAKMLVITLAIGGITALSACGSDAPATNDSPQPAAQPAAPANPAPANSAPTATAADLTGVWGWDMDANGFQLRFNADGTGSWTGLDWDFDWSIQADELRLDIVGDLSAEIIRNQRWSATIIGNDLMLSSLQIDEEWRYIRQAEPAAAEQNAALFGVWGWD